MYRIVASDMDETFIGHDHKVQPANYEAVRLMREDGVKFVVATGRPYYSVQGTLEALGTRGDPDEYTITFNGGYVCANDGRTLASHTLTEKQAQELFDYGVALGLHEHIYTLDHTYTVNMNDNEKAYLSGRMEVEDIPTRTLANLEGPVYKILYMSTDFAWLHTLKDKMEREIPEFMAQFQTSFSAERYFEFNPVGVSKGSGLRDVAECLGIPMSETIGVGDSVNDLPMLLEAGLGLAVSNVTASIADIVPHTLESSCDEAAMMEVYERYIAPDHPTRMR